MQDEGFDFIILIVNVWYVVWRLKHETFADSYLQVEWPLLSNQTDPKLENFSENEKKQLQIRNVMQAD